ncbi:MAG TPA: sigma-70 family RNA polymerase sigma factor [Firmicutes bacterium]|nr:sigma-70 family RNA polymerase sigma factor [Bacillota bacterium]
MSYKNKTESDDLVRRLKRKEEGAFEELIEDYGGVIYKVLHTYIKDKNTVDDLFQDVFIKIFKNVHTFREESKLSVWIYQIALNTTKNHLRKKYNKDIYELQEYTASVDPVDEDLDNKDLRALLETYISGLPENWQTVINLYYFHSYSYNEIADITGFPVGTVKTYLYRAKDKLCSLMEKHRKELS